MQVEDRLPLTGKAFQPAFGKSSLFVSSFQQVYDEIVSICWNSTPPSAINVQKMHFLLATVHESARLLPAGPRL